MLTKVAVFSAVLLTLCLHEIGGSSLKVSKRQVLTNQQLVCIQNSAEGIDSTCSSLLQNLVLLYSSSDPLVAISTQQLQFRTFCLPNCGQVLIDAWESCGALEDAVVSSFAHLLAGMCGSNDDRFCYNDFNPLVGFLNGAINCTREYFATGQCSSFCSTGARDAVQTYGCCVNVILDFESSLNDQVDFRTSVTGRYTNGQFNKVFSECGTERPPRCTNNPLMISAASHVSSFLPMSTVCLSAAAALMYIH